VAYDATEVQIRPTGEGQDVGSHAAERLRQFGLDRVADDLEKRISFGEKKYGQRLRTHNGRDAVLDSYQEILDFLNYLMQGVLEGQDGCQSLFERAVPLASEIQGLLSEAHENKRNTQN
jgi:hypothetical protein